MGAILEAVQPNARPKADGFLNFSVHLVDANGKEHRVPCDAVFALHKTKATHRALLENPEKAMEAGKVIFKVTSVNVVSDEQADISL